jgi:hypothetical protein
MRQGAGLPWLCDVLSVPRGRSAAELLARKLSQTNS